jgi:hypothetical protein
MTGMRSWTSATNRLGSVISMGAGESSRDRTESGLPPTADIFGGTLNDAMGHYRAALARAEGADEKADT